MKDLRNKLKMPKAKKPEVEADVAELEIEMAEMPEGEMSEEEMKMPEAAPELESISDEDLLAEVKKRGLDLSEDMPEGELEMEVSDAEEEA